LEEIHYQTSEKFEDQLLKIDVNCRPTDTCYVYGQDDDQWEILPSLPNPLCGENTICIILFTNVPKELVLKSRIASRDT
jgi:hypothetical protein